MKKKILVLAIAAISLVGFNSFAQTDGDQKCDKKELRMAKKAKCDKEGDCPMACPANPFEGIELTADQQAKLDALKADCQKARADRKAADEKDKKAKMEERKAARQEYLNKVKAILTPEQYTQFLENQAVNGRPHVEGRKGDFRGDRGKGPKCDKAQKCDSAKTCKGESKRCQKK